jgi:hypothetical protein
MLVIYRKQNFVRAPSRKSGIKSVPTLMLEGAASASSSPQASGRGETMAAC